MLAENLFEKIGYEDGMVKEYEKYSEIIGNRFDEFAQSAVKKEISFIDAVKKAEETVPNINKYTCDLMFVIECTGFLLSQYRKKGIPEEMFYNAMRDIKAKTAECMAVKGIFGTFVIEWFDYFFTLDRLAFGRFQYDILKHEGKPLNILGHEIKEGDLYINCHIPSLGPLRHEMSAESFKTAYNYFKNELRDGILVVKCYSWLLFPYYDRVFAKCSDNITNFKNDFAIYDVEYNDEFSDAWRVFNKDFTGDNFESLPEDTRMRRAFKEYIKDANGKKGQYGEGYGVILFDGEKILTNIKDSLI